jgi:hypothetical protein
VAVRRSTRVAWGGGIVTVYAALLLTAFLIGPVPDRSVCQFIAGGSGQTAGGDTSHFGIFVSTAPPTGAVSFTDQGPATPVRLQSIHLATVSCSPNAAEATLTGVATIKAQHPHLVGFRLNLSVLNTKKSSATLRIQLTDGYDSGTDVLTSANLLIQNHRVSRHVVVSPSHRG